MRICYFAGGIAYNKTAGPSAHIANIANELNIKKKVTVELLFNGFCNGPPAVNLKLLDLKNLNGDTITPEMQEHRDDVAIRGLNPIKYIKYIVNTIRFFLKSKGKYDVVIERMWRLGGIYGILSKSKNTIFILEENGPMKFDHKLDSIKNMLRYILHKIQKRYAMFIYNRADAIVVQTAFLKDFLALSFKVDTKKISVIPNGVDTKHFAPTDTKTAKKMVKFPVDKKVMLYVGSIDPFHDLSEIVSAFAEVAQNDLLFVIIGDGTRREELLSKIKRDSVQNVLYLGTIPYDTLPNYINAADVCVAPYNTGDFEDKKFVFSPLKILEYMACAKPVISQPIGYINELVEAGKGGFLSDNKKEKYVEILNAISKMDLETIAKMGDYNRKKVMNLSWSAQADKYIDLINNLGAARN